MRPFVLATWFLFFGLAYAWSADTPSDEAIREAITILEARKAQVEKQEEKDKIAKAIGDLEKLLPQVKKDGGEAKVDTDPAKLITPALLKKKFAGKAAFNPKTSELTLIYSFADKAELTDFDLKGNKPSVAGGTLKLNGGENITHVVEFETLTITGVIGVGNENFAKRISTTKGASLNFTTNRNGQFFSMSIMDKEAAFEKAAVMSAPFQFSVEPKRVSVKWGTTSIGKEITDPQGGQVLLHGATKGTQFQKLILTGKIDSTWAIKFFSK